MVLLGAHTLAELRELDAGSWFSPEFAGERIPTFEEVVEWSTDVGIPLNVELKTGPYPFMDVNLAVKVSGNPEEIRPHWGLSLYFLRPHLNCRS